MMTREEINQLYYIRQEIKMWENHLEHLQAESEAKGSPTYVLGGRSENKFSSPVESLALRTRGMEEIIEELKVKAKMKEREILEYINTIDDSLMRMIITYRVLDGLSWNAVAIRIGGGNNADSIRMKFNRKFPRKK